MGDQTAIAWTHKTWNPFQGCHKVSAGCANCYMYREKKRYGQDPATVVRSKPPTFNAPKKWTEPALVFTCSWSDFFIEEADAWRSEAWDIIRATPHLTYQILTKRPERIRKALPPDWGLGWRNVWLGTTVEDAAHRDRLGPLSSIASEVCFASCEPLIAPVGNLGLGDRERIGNVPLDWVIVGAESGPGARPCDLEWVRDIVRQCQAAHVACFVKQLQIDGRLSKDPAEWPADLRVQKFPEVTP